MAMLARVTDVITRGGLSQYQGIELTVVAALEAATVHLGEVIRTSFDYTPNKDIYWIDSDDRPFNGQFLKIHLSNSFVDLTVPLEMRAATELYNLPTQTPISNDYLLLKEDTGLILVTGSDRIAPPLRPFYLAGKTFLEVSYSSGFSVTATSYGSLHTGVPAWLKEVAIIAAIKLFKKMHDFGDEVAPTRGIGSTDMTLGNLLYPLVERHIRFHPDAFKPLI